MEIEEAQVKNEGRNSGELGPCVASHVMLWSDLTEFREYTMSRCVLDRLGSSNQERRGVRWQLDGAAEFAASSLRSALVCYTLAVYSSPKWFVTALLWSLSLFKAPILNGVLSSVASPFCLVSSTYTS